MHFIYYAFFNLDVSSAMQHAAVKPFQVSLYSNSSIIKAMAPKTARPMAAAKPKRVVNVEVESSCVDLVFEDAFWEYLGRSIVELASLTPLALAEPSSTRCLHVVSLLSTSISLAKVRLDSTSS